MAKNKIRINLNEECYREEFYKAIYEIKDKPFPKVRDIGNENYQIARLTGKRRFYISDKKYYYYEGWSCEDGKGKLITREDCLYVELIELSTKEVCYLDVSLLCHKFTAYILEDEYIEKEMITAMSQARINQYIYNMVKDVKPYITNKELVDVFINYVGKRHIYFEKTEYNVKNSIVGFRTRPILNAYFVKDLENPY